MDSSSDPQSLYGAMDTESPRRKLKKRDSSNDNVSEHESNRKNKLRSRKGRQEDDRVSLDSREMTLKDRQEVYILWVGDTYMNDALSNKMV